MQLRKLLTVLERIAPTRLAEAWDNVGLLCGDPDQDISRALLTIDYTVAVAEEGRSAGCDAVIAYHPPIFSGIKRISPNSVVHDAMRRGIAIYSPHTALDVAEGGTNDVLAEVLGLEERTALKMIEAKSTWLKLVVFVPEEAVSKVSDAIFEAGAGHIRNYSHCGFQTSGTGTFLGEDGSNPAVGQRGRLETVAEVRLETVVLINCVDAVIAALRRSHPYEEPAFDLNLLAAAPKGVGIGRIGALPTPVERVELFERVKTRLEIERVLVAGPADGPVQRVAVAAGAGGGYWTLQSPKVPSST